MHYRSIAILSFISIALLTVSCSGDATNDIHSKDFDKFTDVYAELSVGFEMAGHDSTLYMPIRDSILTALEVDSIWIADYLKKIGDDSEKWLVVWKEITRKLEARKDSLTP
ncbi:MAG: hypothetical protein KKG33_07740 [candidate division Zixibacteria bacterium]|nr:hypothetical protein [candidate division Zixibacteria bacterium]MBU1471666.1 hypothetical protein [candidate division Zixibacteria bacterium]MBU2625438.1 hypothetical protein [candidate division Zixibacteria bacterium]